MSSVPKTPTTRSQTRKTQASETGSIASTGTRSSSKSSKAAPSIWNQPQDAVSPTKLIPYLVAGSLVILSVVIWTYLKFHTKLVTVPRLNQVLGKSNGVRVFVLAQFVPFLDPFRSIDLHSTTEHFLAAPFGLPGESYYLRSCHHQCNQSTVGQRAFGIQTGQDIEQHRGTIAPQLGQSTNPRYLVALGSTPFDRPLGRIVCGWTSVVHRGLPHPPQFPYSWLYLHLCSIRSNHNHQLALRHRSGQEDCVAQCDHGLSSRSLSSTYQDSQQKLVVHNTRRDLLETATSYVYFSI